MALELGSGYVTLLPSAKGFGAKARALTAREMKGAGTDVGAQFTKEMTSSADKNGGKLPKAISKHSKKAADEAEKDGKSAGSRFGGAMKNAALAAVAGVGIAAGALVRTAINEASEAQQGDGAIDAIFGKHGDKIKKQAEKAGAEVGLSYSEYVNKSAASAAFLKNKGIVGDDLVKQTEADMKMAADLSAQYGGTASEAIDAIISARKGETDPIERYGISLNETAVNAKLAEMGMKKVNGQYKESDKLAARNAILVAQSKDAQGAFAREAGTFAQEQQKASVAVRNFAKDLGGYLLPYLAKAFSVVTETVVPALSSFVQGMRDGTGAGGAFVSFLKAIQPFMVPLAAGLTAVVTALAAYRTYTLLANLATKIFSVSLRANPLGLIVTAIGLVVAALVYFYRTNETVRNAINAAWAAIKTAVVGAWTNYIQPAFTAIVAFIRDHLIPWVRGLWVNHIRPAFHAIGAWISSTWTDTIKPAFAALVAFIRDHLIPWVRGLWVNHIRPAFLAIGAWISSTWNNIIKPALSALWGFIKNTLVPVILWLWHNVIKPAFKAIGDIISTAWTKVIKPALDGLKRAAEALPGIFDKAQKGIGTAWDRVRKAALTPVEFVVQTVLNQGLIKNMNSVMDTLKLDKGLRIPYIPWTVKLASGGNVPGWSPNDVADNIPAMLTAGEFVTRRKSVRKMDRNHPGALDHINRTGELPGYAQGGRVGGMQPWPNYVRALLYKMFPAIKTIGGYRHGDPQDHGKGLALDVMVPVSSALGDSVSAWAVANKEALNLKYAIWKQRIIGSGKWGAGWRPMADRGSVTQNHYDHPHLSFNPGSGNPQGLGTVLSPEEVQAALAGGDGGWFDPLGWVWDKVKGLLGNIPGADSPMAHIASGMASRFIDGAKQWAAEKIGFGGGGDGTATGLPAGASVERWRGTVMQALGLAGLPQTPAYAEAWLRQIRSESGGNPGIAQQIRDVNGTGDRAGVGLVQVIPGTFNAHRDPSLPNDRRNPLANLAAGMRYAKSRYGARMLSVIGHGHGYAGGGLVTPTLYDTGGILAPGLTLVSNQTNKPETVRTYEQERALQADLRSEGATTININGIKHDSVTEFANELNFALTLRANARRYGKG